MEEMCLSISVTVWWHVKSVQCGCRRLLLGRWKRIRSAITSCRHRTYIACMMST